MPKTDPRKDGEDQPQVEPRGGAVPPQPPEEGGRTIHTLHVTQEGAEDAESALQAARDQLALEGVPNPDPQVVRQRAGQG